MSTDLLYCVDLSDGPTRRTCWVNRHVKVGNRITLKNSDEPERLWTVDRVGEQRMAKAGIDSSWHVGGL